ncbi:PilZ domain-containing protein [Aliiglaciecola litoralis]|uniref:PilZ domain-containing protein n=1 Tax=Aliiglaciecola litoralis TaxID=582857 RepID=A0ABP3WVE9_9ALTE
MESATLQQKMAQYHEFFTIKHALNVNVVPLDNDFSLPDAANLVSNMPYAFQIASHMSSVDAQALRPLRNLGEHAKDLVEYLHHQNKKIDLMMSFILQQQDEERHRYRSVEFGGGGLAVETQEPMQEGQYVELKVFLSEEAAGVFCYAEVIKCEPAEDGFHAYLLFSRIREEDQELLVRASLHLQTVQLRARSKQQHNESN